MHNFQVSNPRGGKALGTQGWKVGEILLSFSQMSVLLAGFGQEVDTEPFNKLTWSCFLKRDLDLQLSVMLRQWNERLYFFFHRLVWDYVYNHDTKVGYRTLFCFMYLKLKYALLGEKNPSFYSDFQSGPDKGFLKSS